MKKIILIMVLTIMLTACGKKNIKAENFIEKIPNENIIVEADNKIEEVEKDVVIEENSIKESDNLPKNEEKEKSIEKVEEKYKESVKEEVEFVEDQEELETSQIIYEEGIDVGKKAIDFEVELLSGEKVKLSDYLGKPVFLNFWATWCGPCVGEMPYIEKIKNEYGDKLVVLAINSGDYKEDVKTFINKKGYSFNVGIDEKGTVLTIYDSMYIPLSIFIDENGIIQVRKVGALSEENMKTIVEDLI